jgi:hypothetical protein
MVGYRAWFYYAEKRSDAFMEARLDQEQYNENELILIKIALNNPYQVEQSSYERVNGDINFQGRNFKFVKRQISNGNLNLLCLPDNHKMVLKKAKSDFANAGNEMANTGKSSSRNGMQKNFSSNDYISECANVQMCKCANEEVIYNSLRSVRFSDPQIASPGKPPQSRA